MVNVNDFKCATDNETIELAIASRKEIGRASCRERV